MRMPGVVLYPVFAAAYPVLALAAGNVEEIPGLWVLRWPLAISVFVSLAVWLLLTTIVRNPHRRAFLTLMVVLVFAWYGYFTIGLEDIPWAAPYARTVWPLLLVVAYLAAVTHLVFRLVPNLRALTRFLSIFTAVLVAWTTIVLLRRTAEIGDQLHTVEPATISASTRTEPGPDIYLIVLDKYTGSRSLRQNFRFDNTAFESFLVERGFALPRSPQANYMYTQLSLAALLNYRYLDELPSESSAESRTTAYVNHLVEDNAARRFLQERQYKFIFFPTWFRVTGRNRFADVQIPHPRQVLSEFVLVWQRTSLAGAVLTWVCRRVDCANAAKPLVAYGTFLEWEFEQLSQVPRRHSEGRPLFVFAHIPIPHEPYVFYADCTIRPPFWRSVQDDEPEKQAYLAQIACLNRRLQGIVERILRDSPKPPVILLQSDHGHGRMLTPYPDINFARPDRVAERADIFAAYYLPGINGGTIYDSITPVNVFRTVFREYFQADLAPLPDKSYWSSGAQLHKFIRVNRGHRWPE